MDIHLSLEEAAFLLARAGVAFVYLYAAYLNTRSMDWTVDHTAILFRGTGLEQNRSFLKLAASVGVVTMYCGALSVLFGFEGRAGALMLAMFTACGIVIHRREQMAAQEVTKEDFLMSVPEEWRGRMSEMAWSAYAAHLSSWLKNLALIAVAGFFVLEGTGPYSSSDHLAAFLGSFLVPGSH